MKVKILKSKNETTWYKHFVDSEFEVGEYDRNNIRLPFKISGMGWVYESDCVITELPESFCVKSCDDGIKWGKYIQWLNKNYNTDFCGRIFNSDRPYYGVINDEGWGIKIPFGTEIHIDDMIKHIDYMESQQHINGGEQFSKESQLTVKMNKEFNLTSSNEGRLAYARQNYPIGTKYIPLYSTGESWEEHNIKTVNYNTELLENGTIDGGFGFVYASGKWAEIVKEDEFDLTTNERRLAYARKHYPIGTRFKALNCIGDNFGDSKSEYEPKLWEDRGRKGIETSLHGLVYSETTNQWAEIIKEETNMETQKLSRQGLKEIHSVACSTWKITLEGWGSRNPLEDYIELSQKEIDMMFNASDDNQKSILSKYLKQNDGSINFDNLLGDGYKLNERQLIGKRTYGQYKSKSFYLDNKFDWKIQKDEYGELCLIPTK